MNNTNKKELSLTQKTMKTHPNDVDWFDKANPNPQEETTPTGQKTKRRWFSLDTGEKAEPNNEKHWLDKSLLTEKEKTKFNAYYDPQNADEDTQKTNPKLYAISVTAIGLASLAMLLTMFSSLVIQGGWHISGNAPAWLWVLAPVAFISLWVSTWYIITADHPGRHKWAPFGSFLITIALSAIAYSAALFISQLADFTGN